MSDRRPAWIISCVFMISALALSACGSESASDGGSDAATADSGYPPGSTVVKAGDYSLVIMKDSPEIYLAGPAGNLLRFPADGIQLGTVSMLDDMTNYDPLPIANGDPNYVPPDGLRWQGIKSISVTQSDASSATVALGFEKGKSATLSIKTNGPGSVKLSLVPVNAEKIAYYRLRPRTDSTEAFYGLGAYLDDVNNRGKIRPMQMETGDLESASNEAHVPVPLVVGSRGWGLFVELHHAGAFDMATKEKDLVDAMFGTGLDSAKGIVFHLFGAAHPLDVTKHYYDLTGYPTIPAAWALGPWFWRDELYQNKPNASQAQVESDLNIIRDLDLATTAYWIDRPYANGVNSFDFHKVFFSNAQSMINLAHDLGFRMALWHTPYVSSQNEQCDETKALLQYAQQNEYFPPATGLLLNHWGPPMDLTKAEAYAWWQSLIMKYIDMGIEGFKLDYGEDIVVGLMGARNIFEFNDGSDERTMHRGYKLLYHKAYGDMLPRTGGWLLCRAGGWGDQVNVSVIWPGDLDATFADYGEIAKGGDGEEYKSVGGLPASMIYGLSLGPSGFPFYASDTGGYRHSPPDKELLTRWFEQTALSTAMNVGDSSAIAPWEFDRGPNYDQEMLDWYRVYTRLHLRLFPYEWTYAQNLKKDGRPITRALGLAHPELGVHPSDQYMFGDSLLVAPVLKRNVRTKDVTFPAGRWVDWWDGTVYEGGKTVKVDAPLGKLPLYLAEGGIIPLLRPTIDTTSPTTQPDRVDSYVTTPGILYPRVFAGSKSSFALFDGAELRQEKTGTGVTLYYKGGSEFKYGAFFELLAYGTVKPASVKSNGTALTEAASLKVLGEASTGWYLDSASGGALYVKVAAGEQSVEIK
jgi:alpha-D-xyloside xylohydrolase